MHFDDNNISRPLYGMRKISIRLDEKSIGIINSYRGDNFSKKLRNFIYDHINKK